MNSSKADSFLQIIHRSQRGRLKIYLGYAAGVGKTYQMLLEAHRLRETGVDVAVGIVETHGRADTALLLADLEVIPRITTTYHDIVIQEMNLDAILSRRPKVVLVDELAHTNVPGNKYAKRYQDVEEILSAGIHVISTLNIQHIESLYETVERATGIRVKERIPDRVVVDADQLVNVDVTTEDLRQRLREGKVYTTERIETALEHFFKPPNLEALRELTMREMASQIDSRQRESIPDDRPTSPDQVMVCLSSKGPNSDALLRYASRLAGRLNRNWYAVYVQTAREQPTVISAVTQRMLSNALALAQQLGAAVFTYKGDDIVDTILQFAKEYRVGHIVIGASEKKRPLWRRVFGNASIVEQLTIKATGITIVVVDTKPLSVNQHMRRLTQQIQEGQGPGTEFQGEFPVQEDKKSLLNASSKIWNELIDKEEAIKELVDSCGLDNSEMNTQALNEITTRERQGATLVGDQVEIPHARVAGLKRRVIAIGLGKAGIRDVQTGRMARIILLLLSPTVPPQTHLEQLAITSRMAQDNIFIDKVIAANVPRDIVEAVKDWVHGQNESV